MAKHKIPMTIQDHLDTADDLAIVQHHISRMVRRCSNCFPKAHPIMNLLFRYVELGGSINKLQNKLEDVYYDKIDEATTTEHGSVYRNIANRYVEAQRNYITKKTKEILQHSNKST